MTAGVGAFLLRHEPIPVAAAARVLKGATLSQLGVEMPPETFSLTD